MVMLFGRPNPAPEPYATGALWLLYRVALFIRNEPLEKQQVIDLGEAIHNVPDSLTAYGAYFDERKIRDEYLARYDAKWARGPGDFSLLRALDQGMERAAEWRGA
jgi:hypothetical protein